MLIFYVSNEDIADIENADAICSSTVAVNYFLPLFSYPSFFIKDLGSQ